VRGGSRLAALLAAAAVLAAGCGAGPEPVGEEARPTAGKPGVPVEATLEAVGAFSAGAPARFRLTVIPSIEAPDACITFILPRGAAVSEGESSWKGALRAGRKRVSELVVTVPGADRYAVSADVVLAEGKGTRLMKRVSVEVGAGPEKAPAAATAPGYRHRGVSRKDYLENR